MKKTKKQKCDALINRFLASDKHEMLFPALILHILLCKKCRRLIRLYIKTENLCREPLLSVLPPEDSMLVHIMGKINPAFAKTENREIELISLKRWIASGCILICTVFLFAVFSAMEGESKLHLLLFLCFAGFITGYCAFFIGSNLHFFIKKLETLHSGL